jgi:hypothetical protein
MSKKMGRSKIEANSNKAANRVMSRPATPPATLLPAMASILLSALVVFLVLHPSLRMLRLWVSQDGYERHQLNFSVDGVPAEWGYACWTGPLTDDFKSKYGHSQDTALNVTFTLPPKLNQNIDNGPLVINGTTFQTGIGSHAPSKIAFALQGKCNHFSCFVGLDKTSTVNRGVIYTFIADGREIFRSPKLKLDAAPFPVDVSVSGVKELVIYADNMEFYNTGSNVDWVNLNFTQ